MERDTALVGIQALIIAIVILVIGWFFLFPAICRIFPRQLPGQDFDYCFFFR